MLGPHFFAFRPKYWTYERRPPPAFEPRRAAAPAAGAGVGGASVGVARASDARHVARLSLPAGNARPARRAPAPSAVFLRRQIPAAADLRQRRRNVSGDR